MPRAKKKKGLELSGNTWVMNIALWVDQAGFVIFDKNDDNLISVEKLLSFGTISSKSG